VEIKNRFLTKLDWNTLLAKLVDDILCLAWQDNNIVLAMSSIHIVDIVKDFIEKSRKRPTKTSTNARIIQKAFSSKHTKKLEIPLFIDDYNHYMGGVNLANQFKAAYETHKATFKN
jgi:hypothetical protein